MRRKEKLVWFLVSSLIVLALVLASCAQKAATITQSATTPVTSTTMPPANTTTPPANTTTANTTVSTTTAPATTAPTTTANWWDSLGTPVYGGTLDVRVATDGQNFDTWKVPWTATNFDWYETLAQYDQTVNRSTWSFKTAWAPPADCTGNLLASWEMKDPYTLIGHVRQGVKWQPKPPSNGREFTANDIGYHYDRAFGVGDGFTQPNPWYLGWIPAIKSVKVDDKYTIEINFKNPYPTVNMWSVVEMSMPNQIENQDTIKAGISDVTDWKNINGTGPFMLTNYVQSSSFTLTKNPDYWGKDPRFPQNQLPYVDTVNVLVIPDTSTAIGALRTGKLDYIDQIGWKEAQSIAKTNSDLIQATQPADGYTLELRCDKKPFTDIRVREALQMAIDYGSIVKSYYGGLVPAKPNGLIAQDYTGYYIPFDQWPADLQAQYTYNLDGAKKLMSEAGYPNGFNTDVVASNDQTSSDTELLQLVQSEFKDIGVNMTITVMDQTTYMNYTLGGKQNQIAMTDMDAETQPPGISIFQYDSHNATNLTHNNDPAYDALYDKYYTSTSTADAQKNYQAANMYFLQQHWLVQLPARITYTITQPYLGGYDGENMTGMVTAWWWEHLWIKTH